MYQYRKPDSPELSIGRHAMVHSFGVKPTVCGKPATISGYADRFATVTETKTGATAEYSWEAVRYVMEFGDGIFQF